MTCHSSIVQEIHFLPTLYCSVADKLGVLAHMMGATLTSRQKGYDHVYLTTGSRLTSLDPKGNVNWQVGSSFISFH